jgi:hypothetical protein
MQQSEIADRYTIALLKSTRLPLQLQADFAAQAEHFHAGLDLDKYHGLQDLVLDLFEINGQIWDTEKAIRRGEEAQYEPGEIGRMALEVRRLNRARCSVKEQITTVTGGFRDVKHNYAG